MSERTDAVAAALAQASRFYLLALAFAVVLFADDLLRPADDSADVTRRDKSLQDIQRIAADVEQRLRSYLIARGTHAHASPVAVRALLRDVNQARKSVVRVREALSRSGPELLVADDFKTLKRAADICANLIFNESCDEADGAVGAVLRDGSRLMLGQPDPGAFAWDLALPDRTYDELARLLFLASIDPAQLKIDVTDLEVASGFSELRFRHVEAVVGQVHAMMNSEYAVASRKAAARLWPHVHSLGWSPADFGLDFGAVSPRQVQVALSRGRETLERIEAHAAGRFKVKAPVLGEQVSFATLSRIVPYAVAAMLALLAFSFAKAATLARQLEPAAQSTVPTPLPLLALLGLEREPSWIATAGELTLLVLPAVICTYFFPHSTDRWLALLLLWSATAVVVVVYGKLRGSKGN